ncbi:MAG: hypothetical protein WBD41_29930 [Rhodococcus sp. (in: high G+C Gram-positive bacteria)]|uniref:hypothetical protein n=1 Tax=Rhodococcus TaxID=1827 RepID=UPI00071C8E6A|nr:MULTISPECIES: hypothetical protein [Rhodococcus]MCQ4151973.1 hypothetical protein [Rhodococcus qingshengii]
MQITDSIAGGSDTPSLICQGHCIPQSIRVVMQIPSPPDDLTWILDVQLNGQLIECRRLDRTMAATPSPPSTRPPEPTPDGLLDLATELGEIRAWLPVLSTTA